MGLSQLYQLRGRVGRSNRIAYAYFTYQKDKILSEVAEKRLQAIKEFTELGSGFKIAMRDLSIRGAGNLLGAEQHGFIDSVGFDLYSEMLKESIEKRKLNQTHSEEKAINPELNLAIEAYLPDDYISDSKQKITMYKRFQSVESHDEIDDIVEELIDRFGDYPEEVEHLLTVCQLRVDAKKHRIESVKELQNKLIIVFDEKMTQKIDGEKLFNYAVDFGKMILLGTEDEKLKITFTFQRKLYPKRYEYLQSFLVALEKLKRE